MIAPLSEAIAAARAAEPMHLEGSVAALRGLTLLVDDLSAPIGTIVAVRRADGPESMGEVVGFDGGRAVVMLLESAVALRAGDRVIARQTTPTIPIGPLHLGRVIDALGRPLDGLPAPRLASAARLVPPPVNAMRRARIRDAMPTGVRAVDLMTTVGRGQRLGIFAGPGVGKSTLLGMIARRTEAQVNIIALIGERGREVREFIDDALGEEGLRRSLVVVSTSDESPLMRVRAAQAASAAAEWFRDRGVQVMLMIDSITRFAHAQRQIGLAVGEPPATRGYTPSVFAALPALLERAGMGPPRADGSPPGSITAFYTILVEGDDMTEPIADASRGILDGHLILSRAIAQRGHYPAIDPLDSISRLANEISTKEHAEARRVILRLLAAHRDVQELLLIGAYAPGADPVTDAAVQLKPRIDALLQQRTSEPTEALAVIVQKLVRLAREAEPMMRQPARHGQPATARAAPAAR